MGAVLKRRGAGLSAPVIPALMVVAACSSDSPSTLRPAGPGARHVEDLWWPLFWISVAVCVIVVVGVLVVVVRRRRRGHVDHREPTRFVVAAGVVVPFLVLAGVYLISLRVTLAISGPPTGTSTASPLAVEVIGHQWWWEVRYPPGTGVVTANEIHIPAGRDVRLQLSTADVLHSFWVPQLMPKTDLIAGRTNTMWLHADKPGTYRGQCAEYCGMQHAHMAFVVIAQPADEFDRWLGAARLSASPGTDQQNRGLQAFLQTGCGSCHTIAGTAANGRIGPDLTTVGSRWSIGAGTVPNDDAHLRDWIENSQQLKPGNAMPPQPVAASDMPGLIAYLRSLQPLTQGAP